MGCLSYFHASEFPYGLLSALLYCGSVETRKCLGVNGILINSLLDQHAIMAELCTAGQEVS